VNASQFYVIPTILSLLYDLFRDISAADLAVGAGSILCEGIVRLNVVDSGVKDMTLCPR